MRDHVSKYSAYTNKYKVLIDPDYLTAFEDKLFIEGPQTTRRLTNFFALLLFATIIATYGVLSNSTATVIGAMIVAPLMGPIMATTAAVVMGSSQRTLKAFGLTVAGILSVILLAYLLSWVVPELPSPFTEQRRDCFTHQSARLYALLTALGAGAAGAFITSRAEIADSMAPVAIAISLVPPLCVVGIRGRRRTVGCRRWRPPAVFDQLPGDSAGGGVVLAVVGLGKLTRSQEGPRIRKRGFVVFIVCPSCWSRSRSH